jgi:hypothetical protein
MNYKHVLWLIHGTRQVNKKEEKVEVKSVTERERVSNSMHVVPILHKNSSVITMVGLKLSPKSE